MKINGGWIALLVIIILVTIAILWFVWWKFFYKKNEQNSGFLTRHRFKKTTHLLSMNNKYQNKSGIVLESGKLGFFKNIKLTQKLELKKWAARVSDQLSGIVIAAPGSGKTQSTILPTIMFNATATDKPRMIVTDPKGECYKATHKFLEQQGIKTYVLNFNDSNSTQNLYTHCFNPLSKIIELHKKYCAVQDSVVKEIYLGKLRSKIHRFVNLFDVFNNSNGEMIWWDTGKKIVKTILSLMLFALENKNINFINAYNYDQINLATLQQNLSRTNILDLSQQIQTFLQNQEKNKAENWFLEFADWIELDPRQIPSFKLNAINLLDIFNEPKNQYLTAKSDFDLHNFLKEQSVLFLVLPNSETNRKITNFFLEIFYDDLMEIISNDYNDKLPFPCWFIIDEAGTMQRISWLGEVLNQGRGRNMHLLTVFQNTEQIDAKYKGQGLTKSSQYKILYSSQDLKYAEEIAKAIGYKQDAKNQQDLIIKPNQILKIEPEKSLLVSVKENKPYFTTNLAFWKVKNIRFDSKLYYQPIFTLQEKYVKVFQFSEILTACLRDDRNVQKNLNQEKNEVQTKQLENKEISSIEQQGKETKKAMMLELNNFLNSNNFNDDIKENIQKSFLVLIKNLTNFEKVFDKNQNQTIYQMIKNNVDEIWEQIDRNIEWDFLKNLQNQTKQRYNQNKELYEIIESDNTDDFDFDLSDLQKQNKSDTQTERSTNQNFETPNFERKPLGNNPLLRQAMMKFWRQKWGDKLTAEIFQDKKKKE